MNPKIRNSIAEAISLLSLASSFVPQFKDAGINLPPWAGILIALLVTVGNQWIKDSTPPPTASTLAAVEAQPSPAATPVAAPALVAKPSPPSAIVFPHVPQ